MLHTSCCLKVLRQWIDNRNKALQLRPALMQANRIPEINANNDQRSLLE